MHIFEIMLRHFLILVGFDMSLIGRAFNCCLTAMIVNLSKKLNSLKHKVYIVKPGFIVKLEFTEVTSLFFAEIIDCGYSLEV